MLNCGQTPERFWWFMNMICPCRYLKDTSHVNWSSQSPGLKLCRNNLVAADGVTSSQVKSDPCHHHVHLLQGVHHARIGYLGFLCGACKTLSASHPRPNPRNRSHKRHRGNLRRRASYSSAGLRVRPCYAGCSGKGQACQKACGGLVWAAKEDKKRTNTKV